jgi:hypothetical protein
LDLAAGVGVAAALGEVRADGDAGEVAKPPLQAKDASATEKLRTSVERPFTAPS